MKKRYSIFFLLCVLLLASCAKIEEKPVSRIKGVGEMCGGIAGFMCEEGLECKMEGNYPDAAGTCVKKEAREEKVANLDYSCSTDTDCTVKNIGNCCGYFPACINKNSEPDPERVKADCEKRGKVSVCGFPEIESCSCSEGKCVAN